MQNHIPIIRKTSQDCEKKKINDLLLENIALLQEKKIFLRKHLISTFLTHAMMHRHMKYVDSTVSV